jgi:hypothetical protein
MTAESTFVETPATLAPETLPNLEDLADEPTGPFSVGWYKADVIEGYSTRSGKQFVTEDVVSQKGDSRNLRVCVKVTPASGDSRNFQFQFNYRASDWTPERIEFIKEMRKDMAGVKNWPDRDAQRTSLALAKIGQFQKAIGFQLPILNGALLAGPLVDKKLDVRLVINPDGYNDVQSFATPGKFTPKARS